MDHIQESIQATQLQLMEFPRPTLVLSQFKAYKLEASSLKIQPKRLSLEFQTMGLIFKQ